MTGGSLAQLANVIASIMTEPGVVPWRQATFFPFSLTSRLARGESLKLRIDSPTYLTEQYGEVPLVDAAASHDKETGSTSVFLVNRSKDQTVSLAVDVSGLSGARLVSSQSIYAEDIKAANTLSNPDRAGLRQNSSAQINEGRLIIELPPVSWTAIELA